MNANTLRKHFEKMGARIKVGKMNPPRGRMIVEGDPWSIDIKRDSEGEFYELNLLPGGEVEPHVVSIDPKDRHLLLMLKINGSNPDSTKHQKSKLLCGHDERAWFVSSVAGGASTVKEAKEALKPIGAVDAQSKAKVKAKDRNRRKNAAFIRQGEWFFIPDSKFRVPKGVHILCNEQIRADMRGKPHVCEELVRSGGFTVYVCTQLRGRFPDGLREQQYQELLKKEPEMKKQSWTPMRANPNMHVRGTVRHSDHKTIKLNGWHRVEINREQRSTGPTFRDNGVRFLD